MKAAALVASPHLRVESFRFREGWAATAEAEVATDLPTLWEALLDLEAFPREVPGVDHASFERLSDTEARCTIGGRLGVWKLGVPLDFRYRMRIDHHKRLELVEYEKGVFHDVWFTHEVAPLAAGRTRLTSTFYFDLKGFPLLSAFRLFERHPWMSEMLNLMATAMMVRSFQRRWEPTEE